MKFNAPQASDILSAADVDGHLLIVVPTEYRTGIVTRYGEKDGIVVSVVDLDDTVNGTNEHPVYHGACWFGGKLIGNLKGQIGQTLLGRMAKGQAQNGNQPPWQLEDATGDQAAITKATTWAAAHPDFERAVQGFVVTNTPAPAQRTAPAAAPVSPAPTAVPAGVNAATGEMSPELLAALDLLKAQQNA